MRKRILILSALVKSTGNATTAEKLAGYLSPHHEVFLKNVHEETFDELKIFVAKNRIEVALGVHALLGGPFLQALGLPYVLILAGTDIYQSVHPLHEKQKRKVIEAASVVVTYTESHLLTARSYWPAVREKSRAIFKAIDVSGRDESFRIREFLGIPSDSHLILLPSGIRKIKDPAHGVDGLEEFRRNASPRSILAIVGPVLEENCGEELFRKLRTQPGARYSGPIPRACMLSAIAQADVVINTSIGEGASNALLEAMALGTPVVARRNDGNVAVVQDGLNGWIYDEPSELWSILSSMVANPGESRRRSQAALGSMQTRQTPQLEAQAYEAALLEALS